MCGDHQTPTYGIFAINYCWPTIQYPFAASLATSSNENTCLFAFERGDLWHKHMPLSMTRQLHGILFISVYHQFYDLLADAIVRIAIVECLLSTLSSLSIFATFDRSILHSCNGLITIANAAVALPVGTW